MGPEAADFASDRYGKTVTLTGLFTLRTGSCDHFAQMAPSTVLLAAAAFAFASSSVAASTIDESVDAPSAGTVHRLSPREAEAVQDAAANRNINAPALDDHRVPDGRIHGEIGFGIGTGGYSSVFGTAIVPLGEDGFAAFSFERANFGRRRSGY